MKPKAIIVISKCLAPKDWRNEEANTKGPEARIMRGVVKLYS